MASSSPTHSAAETLSAFSLRGIDAVLFDLDGVLTATAKIHAACWKQMFDVFLRRRSTRIGQAFRPFSVDDYNRYVDGKPRYDGVRSFLASRRITLPEGTSAAAPDEASVHGLGNRKDELVRHAIQAGRIETYPGSIAFVRWVREQGLKTAVVSSSRNCAAVVRAAGIGNLFDVRVDGEVIARLGLPGKPAPDAYLQAATLLGVPAARATVVEDAVAGVQAGRAGGFGVVIGVDRGGKRAALRENGADIVVADLLELLPDAAGGHNR